MKKSFILILSPLALLAACGGPGASAEEDADTSEASTETEFDQQLSDAEANAALDALDEEETAPAAE